MVQALIEIGERQDRILTIVKGRYGLKTKSQAVNLVIDKFEKEELENFLDGPINPAYAVKLTEKRRKGSLISYSSAQELWDEIENENSRIRKKPAKKDQNTP